jgi:hypothetical protein
LTRGKQVTLQPTRELSHILDAPQHVRSKVQTNPVQRLVMASARGLNGLFGKLSAIVIDCDECVGALVNIDSYDHHSRSLLQPVTE